MTALQSGGSSFADVLELLPLNSITSGTCKQCYVTFYSELYALMRTDSAARTACATKYLVADNTACAEKLTAPLNNFHACAGLHRLHYALRVDSQCSASDWSLFDTTFQAYASVAKCSEKTGTALTKCVQESSALSLASSSAGCMQCWKNLATNIGAYGVSSCLTDPTNTTCSSGIDGAQMTIGDFGRKGMLSPLTEFRVCTGQSITTAATTCSTTESDAIIALGLSVRQLVIAMLASSESATTESSVVASVMSWLPPTIAGSTCARSFAALAVLVYRNKGLLSLVCTSSGTDEICMVALTDLQIPSVFKATSGMDLSGFPNTNSTLTTVYETVGIVSTTYLPSSATKAYYGAVPALLAVLAFLN